MLGRRDVPNRFEQPLRVKPIDPRERRVLDRLQMVPRALPTNHLGLEEADDRFGQRVDRAGGQDCDGARRARPLWGHCLPGQTHRRECCRSWSTDQRKDTRSFVRRVRRRPGQRLYHPHSRTNRRGSRPTARCAPPRGARCSAWPRTACPGRCDGIRSAVSAPQRA